MLCNSILPSSPLATMSDCQVPKMFSAARGMLPDRPEPRGVGLHASFGVQVGCDMRIAQIEQGTEGDRGPSVRKALASAHVLLFVPQCTCPQQARGYLCFFGFYSRVDLLQFSL